LNLPINRVLAFTYRNYAFAKRNLFPFLEMIFWPAIGLVSIGLMGDFLSLEDKMRSFLLIGAIYSGVLQVTQLDVSYSLLYDVWSKSIKQTFLAPISQYGYIIGAWLFGIVRGTVVFVLLGIFSWLSFGFKLPSIDIVAISLAGILLYALILGMFVCFWVLLYGQRIDIIAWTLSILSMLVCGIYYPVTYLPKFFVWMAQLLPLTYFLEYFRLGYGFPLTFRYPLIKGFGLTLIYVFILFYMLGRAFYKSRKSGMMLRLSE